MDKNTKTVLMNVVLNSMFNGYSTGGVDGIYKYIEDTWGTSELERFDLLASRVYNESFE